MLKKLIILFVIGITAGCNQNTFNVDEILMEVKSEYVPDSRVAVFDVNAENSTGKVVLTGQTNKKESITKLEEILRKKNINFENKIELLPSKELGNKIYGIVTLSTINLRYQPKNSAELATQALLGMPLRILDKKGDWYRVQTPDDYLAWTEGYGFTEVDEAGFNNWINADKIIYLGDYGFSYSEKDVKSLRVTDLTLTNLLKLKNSGKDFYEVEYPDGKTAFVNKSEAQVFGKWLDKLKPSAKRLLQLGQQYMGVPYLWGGTSPKGYDCSGFTKTMYFMNGVILPRDASQQVNVGELVDTKNGFENLKPGDLLFFGVHGTDKRKERITHVGIYKGNMEFIHESGKVLINSFDEKADNFSEHRLKGFIRARRILGVDGESTIKYIKDCKLYFGKQGS